MDPSDTRTETGTPTRAETAAAPAAATATEGDPGAGPARRDEVSVLLVNDDPGTLFALRAILTDLDAEIVCAASGEQALMRLLHQDFVAIVLDVKMAGLDGFETARLIRLRPRSQCTPIIFLTSHRATDLDRTKGYDLGAADYLFMPVPPEVLKAKVQGLIDLARSQPPPGAAAGGAAGGPERCADAERLIVQHAGDYVALLDSAGAWLYASPSYVDEFGAAIELGGNYAGIVHADDRERVRAALAQLVAGDAHRRLQYRVLGRTGRYLESATNLVRAPSGAVTQVVMVSRDITERKEMEAYVLHQSFHDALTGLPNRLLLEDRMRQATAQGERQHATVAVLFIDLDHFKEINDSLGHAAGDRLLQDVAERLGTCVRDGDTVARLGGDEFVVLLVGMHDVEDAALVADKILAAVSAACQIEGRHLRVTPSVGIAVFPDDGQQAATLLRNADTAMYHAKQEGGARFSFFTPRMHEAASRKLELSCALQRAVGAGEFVLHYQPKVCAASGDICGFEALMRWPQADGRAIPPAVFIPVAEETGRIEVIGAWAIREAAAQLRRWGALGLGGVPIAVNVSALQLRRDTVARDIAAVVRGAGIAPSMLELELTESAVMGNPALAVQTLRQIHALGITIAIDDFGTGHSSLAYLKRLPIDKLKIDASFVRDIATDAGDAAIVLAIITLAHVLRLTVIAEGVETAAQMEFLIAHGCDELQGHYFSEPVSNEQALELLRRGPFRLARPQTGGAA
ncbi:putative bifunctional diguanylate cyclase/phosphodiesterase [Janthinobacterium sp. CG3]|uniref:putative bifunctional diguanylate cyclase/phosphodiesterase n=1 Tax=Janthinobacterium sp. CG3 TaxID=1075768 RepID=UPI00034677E8|nr:EAL domain-containing protein [Janthinobacterium sp. CG3]